MNFTPEFLLQIVVALGSGFGAYAAIRADLATLHERSTNTANAVADLHRRVDQMKG